jgi:hypothetical protein
MPYCASALLSTTRDCLERPVTPSREGFSGDQETLPLVAPFDEPRKVGMYFVVKAFSAGPLDAMIALRRICQSSDAKPRSRKLLHVDLCARDRVRKTIRAVDVVWLEAVVIQDDAHRTDDGDHPAQGHDGPGGDLL